VPKVSIAESDLAHQLLDIGPLDADRHGFTAFDLNAVFFRCVGMPGASSALAFALPAWALASSDRVCCRRLKPRTSLACPTRISRQFSASSCKARSSSGVTDVLGSYTTFSSMQLDAARLAATQHAHLAVFYLFLSIAAGLVAALAGAALAYVQGGS
jgi:hypothetical protein